MNSFFRFGLFIYVFSLIGTVFGELEVTLDVEDLGAVELDGAIEGLDAGVSIGSDGIDLEIAGLGIDERLDLEGDGLGIETDVSVGLGIGADVGVGLDISVDGEIDVGIAGLDANVELDISKEGNNGNLETEIENVIKKSPGVYFNNLNEHENDIKVKEINVGSAKFEFENFRETKTDLETNVEKSDIDHFFNHNPRHRYGFDHGYDSFHFSPKYHSGLYNNHHLISPEYYNGIYGYYPYHHHHDHHYHDHHHHDHHHDHHGYHHPYHHF